MSADLFADTSHLARHRCTDSHQYPHSDRPDGHVTVGEQLDEDEDERRNDRRDCDEVRQSA